jgi:hypothetical protein
MLVLVSRTEFCKIPAFGSVAPCGAGVSARFLKFYHTAPYKLLRRARCRVQAGL